MSTSGTGQHPPGPPPFLPLWALLTLKFAGAFRDLLIIMIGILTLEQTPTSVAMFGGGQWGAAAWSSMLIIGGVTALIGSVIERGAIECSGCFMVGAGFAVWGTAALLQPQVDSVAMAVAGVFFAGTIGQVWRGVVAASGALSIGYGRGQ